MVREQHRRRRDHAPGCRASEDAERRCDDLEGKIPADTMKEPPARNNTPPAIADDPHGRGPDCLLSRPNTTPGGSAGDSIGVQRRVRADVAIVARRRRCSRQRAHRALSSSPAARGFRHRASRGPRHAIDAAPGHRDQSTALPRPTCATSRPTCSVAAAAAIRLRFWRAAGTVRVVLGDGAARLAPGASHVVDSLTIRRRRQSTDAGLRRGIVTRKLDDGREFRIVKVFHEPAPLATSLEALATARIGTPRHFIRGRARPVDRGRSRGRLRVVVRVP